MNCPACLLILGLLQGVVYGHVGLSREADFQVADNHQSWLVSGEEGNAREKETRDHIDIDTGGRLPDFSFHTIIQGYPLISNTITINF